MPESILEETKENQSPKGSGLPYRSVFAVLTLDTILVYDTHHDRPLAVARGLHYAGLTDCCWSKDGLNLMVCSTDGYVSILSFEKGELGQVYTPPALPALMETKEDDTTELVTQPPPTATDVVPPDASAQIPPCAPGQAAVLEAPPTKRAKKTRVTPTLVSALGERAATPQVATKNTAPAKRALAAEADSVGDAVNKLTLETASGAVTAQQDKPVKKKKRVQPVLVSN